ncbi:hypothetical protein TNCV_824381 [Trichonephila clavipes]|nr:hypothetical protein TNCV_824381 [Trichonephila clavipes]
MPRDCPEPDILEAIPSLDHCPQQSCKVDTFPPSLTAISRKENPPSRSLITLPRSNSKSVKPLYKFAVIDRESFRECLSSLTIPALQERPNVYKPLSLYKMEQLITLVANSKHYTGVALVIIVLPRCFLDDWPSGSPT